MSKLKNYIFVIINENGEIVRYCSQLSEEEINEYLEKNPKCKATFVLDDM